MDIKKFEHNQNCKYILIRNKSSARNAV